MTTVDCVTGCGTTTNGEYLCRTCTRHLVTRLRGVPALSVLLTDVTARQRGTSDELGVRSRSADTPLPVNLAAAETARDLHAVLATWCRDVAERNGFVLPDADTTTTIAAWLAGHTTTIRIHPAVDELTDEIHDAITRAWRTVDRPTQPAYAGPCDDCGTDLYVRPVAAIVTCGQCGADYDTAERRDWLLEQVRDQLATAATIARALPGLLHHRLTPEMIRGWAHRGRLAARPGVSGHPRYRIGDVIDLVAST